MRIKKYLTLIFFFGITVLIVSDIVVKIKVPGRFIREQNMMMMMIIIIIIITFVINYY